MYRFTYNLTNETYRAHCKILNETTEHYMFPLASTQFYDQLTDMGIVTKNKLKVIQVVMHDKNTDTVAVNTAIHNIHLK